MASSRPQPAPFLWRPAAQPDIVRAAQKDDLYLQQSVDAAHDVVRRVFGALPALQYSRETKLVATLAYHALTTGAGLQTLGEEYCDILQMTAGNTQLPPAGVRAALVLLQSLGPYLMDRLVVSLERSGASAAMEGLYWDPSPPSSPRGLPEPSFSSWSPGRPSTSNSSLPTQQPSTPQPLSSTLQSWAGRQLRQLSTARQEARARLVGNWPEAKAWLAFAGRVHLAAFYLAGTYYSWSKRLSGVTYTSVSAMPDRRASYQVLGLLLVAQLAISAAVQAQPHLALITKPASQRALLQQQEQQQHAVVLDEQPQASSSGCAGSRAMGATSSRADAGRKGSLVVEHASSTTHAAGAGSRTCPLCLSPRTDPTCTPCGHVFCWQCVAQWCASKPECPLCRAPAAPSQLVCVAGGGF